MQQVSLLARVASPESLLPLTEDGAQLQENIFAVKDLIILKREEAESLSKPQQVKYAQVTKSEVPHYPVIVQENQDPSPKESEFSNTQGQQGQSSSHVSPKAKELHKDSSDHEDFIKDLQDFKQLAERTEDWLKQMQQSVDIRETDVQNIAAKTMERLQGLKVKINNL